MPKRKSTSKETDGGYILKIVLYLIIGSQWLWVVNSDASRQIPIPIGLLLGGFFAAHDHFQIDRKIEYALLLAAAFIGFWSQAGLIVTLL